MSGADDLVAAAQRQIDEHREWLVAEIERLWVEVGGHAACAIYADQASRIGLRVVTAAGALVSVVYDYPDELYAFLSSDAAPAHLRATLAGGHAVDPSAPLSTVRREP